MSLQDNIFYLQPSKIYLILAIFIYVFGLSVVISYANLSLMLILLIVIAYFATRFFIKIISFKDNDIIAIQVNKSNMILHQKNGNKLKQIITKPIFSSTYLLIINTDKQPLVIFKDSIKSAKISQLNYFFTIYGEKSNTKP